MFQKGFCMDTPNRKFIMYIPFNNAKWSPARLTREWISKRLDLFFQFCYPSLIGQTNQDFLAFLYYDPESTDIITELLQNYPALPDNIVFTTEALGRQIYKNYIRGYTHLYLIRTDSDNALKNDFVEQMHQIEVTPEHQAILAQKGYVFYLPTKELVYYEYHSPAFYALLFTCEDIKNNKRYNLPHGHEDVHTLNYVPMEGHNFVISVHELNNSLDSTLVTGKAKVENPREVLKEFHLEHLLDEE